ncbi:MAG: tryptophan--tRNA ligase [Nanoarchaeota archaeon]|nr:tryptophan--tRNA ligase [Nanoarchaeota archaeon]MBU1501528.1 tryptophan--tRNA ligase [Nanoarchaeota archaeon]
MKKVSEFKVTPWEVSGKVDYDKLVREFGVSKIEDSLLKRIEKNAGDLHFMLRRKVFFAHRDLKWILDEYDKGNKFFLYTGRAPSGSVHLGHLLPWIFTKWLQDKFGVELWFQFPDEEKFLFKNDLSFEDTEKFLNENMLDVIALGFDPKKTHFIIDTKNADLMYKEACKVAKKITFSMVKSSFGLNEQSNVGSIFYTSMQAVPAFLPSVIKGKEIPCLIPHAIDQDPHFRLTRDIMPKLGHYKPASIQCLFLPPLSGAEGKMSSSEDMAIFTTDSPKEVEKKIKKYAFSGGRDTIEEHRKKGGNPDIDVSFQYLKMFFEPDDKKLAQIEKDYRSGKLLTSELKEYLIEKINAFLKEHQNKREKAKKEIEKFLYKS